MKQGPEGFHGIQRIRGILECMSSRSTCFVDTEAKQLRLPAAGC